MIKLVLSGENTEKIIQILHSVLNIIRLYFIVRIITEILFMITN